MSFLSYEQLAIAYIVDNFTKLVPADLSKLGERRMEVICSQALEIIFIKISHTVGSYFSASNALYLQINEDATP